jgi:hypothetical protein
MGTLIPLGPALVGLAAGNLQMMSENLVIAFATTVVGLLVGTLAGTIVGTKKRWYRADAALVGFALSRLSRAPLPVKTLPRISPASSRKTGGTGMPCRAPAATTVRKRRNLILTSTRGGTLRCFAHSPDDATAI